jgi:ATP-dependent Clp protease ATP-binding subunit ClpA
MYPFERFTERAKKVLALAHDEARGCRHGYIGTEHLLVGLLADERCLAAIVLNGLDVHLGPVREAVRAALPDGDGKELEPIVPTSRVRQVIGHAYEEARRSHLNYVGTEHLLIGLLIEGDGMAAGLLREHGVTLEGARARVDDNLARATRELERPPSLQPPVQPGPEISVLMRRALIVARQRNAASMGPEHLLEAMLRSGGAEAMARLLDVQHIGTAREELIRSGDFEGAAGRRTAEHEARSVYEAAAASWRQQLQAPGPESAVQP